MRPIAILIGGLVPALMFGVSTVLMKQSTKDGISIPVYLVVTGLSVLALGLIGMAFTGTGEWSLKSGAGASGAGITWAIAVMCMVYGLTTLKLPVAVISPLSNSSVLIAVLISAWLYSEWKEMSVMKLLIGAVLICAGATMVSMASEAK